MSNLVEYQAADEKIQNLKSHIRELEKLKRDLESGLRKEANSEMAKIVPDYAFSAEEVKVSHFDIPGSIRLTRTMLNHDEFSKLIEKYGKLSGVPDAQVHSVSYLLTREGILASAGGGYCVLNSGMECTETEWERIRNGDVPAKFHYDYDSSKKGW